MLKISSYILYYRILYELLNIFYILLKKSFLKTKKMIKDLFKNEDWILFIIVISNSNSY